MDIQTITQEVEKKSVVYYKLEEDDWLLIRLTDQKRGWVRKNAVAKIQE